MSYGIAGVYVSLALFRVAEVQAVLALLLQIVIYICAFRAGILSVSSLHGAYITVCLLLGSAFVQRRVASGDPLRTGRAQMLRKAAQFAKQTKNRHPTVVVTGANTGIGFECAKTLCKLGYRVIITCRSDAKCRETVARVMSAAPVATNKGTKQSEVGGTVEAVDMSLEDEASVRRAAHKIGALLSSDGIDLILNNAGMFDPIVNKRSRQSRELLVDVNFLGPLLLSELLLHQQRSKSNAVCRVVNVSSIAHLWATIPAGETPLTLLKACCDEASTVRVNTYGLSKLLQVMHTRHLAKEMTSQGRKVEVVSVHPGAVLTDIFRRLGAVSKAMPYVLPLLWKNPSEGACAVLNAAFADRHDASFFFSDFAALDDVCAETVRDDKLCADVTALARSTLKL